MFLWLLCGWLIVGFRFCLVDCFELVVGVKCLLFVCVGDVVGLLFGIVFVCYFTLCWLLGVWCLVVNLF